MDLRIIKLYPQTCKQQIAVKIQEGIKPCAELTLDPVLVTSILDKDEEKIMSYLLVCELSIYNNYIICHAYLYG